MGRKRKYYFPPKKTPTPLQVGDDVKGELLKIAEEIVAKREAENLSNYIAFTLEALTRLGWTGKLRLNRFLSMLTIVSSEATDADDPTAYVREIKERLTSKGVVAFIEEHKNADRPQLKGTQSEK